MTFPDDADFIEIRIKSVSPRGDGGYTIEREDGWSFGGIDANPPIVPTKGMTARFYGKGIGYGVRGLFIDGAKIYYRTEAEEESRRLAEVAESERKQREGFEAKRAALDAQYAALPEVFRRRIDKFRTNNPDFRWKFEGYEMFCCEQAVLIANTLKTREAIEKFHAAKWVKQQSLVPGLSDGHSGNTFGCACGLAMHYLVMPENVVKLHGAMAPLVGSEEYGCVERPSK